MSEHIQAEHVTLMGVYHMVMCIYNVTSNETLFEQNKDVDCHPILK